MHRTWLVARREYLHNIRQPSFLFAAFGTPLMIVIIFGVAMFFAMRSTEGIRERIEAGEYQLGFVDQSGLVPQDIPAQGFSEEQVPFPQVYVRFETSDDARAALDARDIDAYFVVAADYIQTGNVALYSYDTEVTTPLQRHINGLLNASLSLDLVTELPVERITRPIASEGLSIFTLDTGRELDQRTLPTLIILPMFFAIVFTLATQITSGYLMSGLVEEKSNRMMEMLVTSITPMQMLSGKILGLGALGLTQLAVWIAGAGVVFVLGRDLPMLENAVFPIDLVLVALLYCVLGYFLTAAVMAGIGAVVGSEQESRQYAGIISLVQFVPYFFLVQFLTSPDGIAPVALSIIPFTSPMAMIMRYGLTTVPMWQLALSVGLLLVTTVVVMWMSARFFRWGLLMYGKRFSLRTVWAVISGQAEVGTVVARSENGGGGMARASGREV